MRRRRCRCRRCHRRCRRRRRQLPPLLPRRLDIVLLDGNIPHGVTGLGDISQKGKRGAQHLPKRAELERFSVIMFSHFQRARGMMKHGNYDGKWCDSYMAGMATKA